MSACWVETIRANVLVRNILTGQGKRDMNGVCATRLVVTYDVSAAGGWDTLTIERNVGVPHRRGMHIFVRYSVMECRCEMLGMLGETVKVDESVLTSVLRAYSLIH